MLVTGVVEVRRRCCSYIIESYLMLLVVMILVQLLRLAYVIVELDSSLLVRRVEIMVVILLAVAGE